MNTRDVEQVIMKNRPDEPFVLVQRAPEEIDDLSNLDWQSDTDPPTLKEVIAWYNQFTTDRDAKIASDKETADALVVLKDDLATQYQTAVDRLNAIITNGPTYTAVQTRDAVVDMAKIELRMLKLMKSALT